MALDKKQPIYFAMDHTSGKDRTIRDNIVGKLRNAGLNVVSTAIGPNEMYQNMVKVYRSGKTNAIIFNLFNGVDPSNIREVARNGNDNQGRTVNQRGNTIVLGWFYDSCDPVHENGRCYKSVRGSETGGRLNNPGKYMKDNNIIGLCCSSDMHTKMANADYTGDKIAQEFINLFSDTETTEEETPEPEEPERYITSVVTEELYTIPADMKVIASKTDVNGVFNEHLKLKYKGDYIVRLHYAGDKENAPITRTIHLNNQLGELYQQKLLYSKTTTTYSDNTNEVTETGKKESLVHTKTVKTTITYENGAEKNRTVTEVDNDKINTDDQTETAQTSIDTSVPGTASTNTGKRSPWLNNIPLVNDLPDVNSMQDSNKPFKFIERKQYTLNKDNFRDPYYYDSKIMQLKGGVTKYTAFQAKSESGTYIVCSREKWNAIEESIHYYLIKHRGDDWPNEIIVDNVNFRTKCDGEWINWKGGTCKNIIVRDRQNTTYTCGPTSCSVCTQALHHYKSEQYMQRKIHATKADGSDPATHRVKLNNEGFKATLYSGMTKASSHLRRGYPCVWHIYGHYFALCDITDDDYVLASNSSGHGANGWVHKNRIKNSFYGQGVLVEPNWTISDNQKTRMNKFFNNFGGKWVKTNPRSESIRQP